MSTSVVSPLRLADIPELHDFAVDNAGMIVIFTLDESVAPCPKCDSTKNWLDRKHVSYIERTVADADAPVLQAVRAHLGLSATTPVSFPLVFNHNGEYAWNDLNRFKLMELEKQLTNVNA